jgi:peptidoglycan-associated lipoprotein
MSRKSLVWALMVVTLPLFFGCPKKKPQTPPETLAVETAPVPTPPAEEVAPPAPPPTRDIEEETLPSDVAELNRVLVERGLIGDVYFEFDKSDLSSESRSRLAQNAAWMRDNPRYLFLIEGHCDERGTNEYNIALGQRRANAAKDYVVSLGVAADRVRTISYGEERPFCTESAEGCWQRNRRAHFVATGTR